MTRLTWLAIVFALAGCVDTDPARRTRSFDEAAFASLRPRTSAEAVLERLGTPTRVTKDGRIVWYYGAGFPPRSPIVTDRAAGQRRLAAIYLTRDFKVERAVLYVLVDDVVVDAATRARADEGAAQMWRLLYDEP